MEHFDWTKPGLWLGLTVEPSKTGGSEGSGNTYQFKNWDGTHVTYTNWEDGQPDYEVLVETKKTACTGLDAYDGKIFIFIRFIFTDNILHSIKDIVKNKSKCRRKRAGIILAA